MSPSQRVLIRCVVLVLLGVIAVAMPMDLSAFGLHEHESTRQGAAAAVESGPDEPPAQPHHCELSVSLADVVPLVRLLPPRGAVSTVSARDPLSACGVVALPLIPPRV